ncbi:uncharacterized protein [Antedon mediterranea]|uniref:uncharacterized protein n=1 Tax=Antedon mediterranea TaxID=105859 RepID=UPI003AF4CB1F
MSSSKPRTRRGTSQKAPENDGGSGIEKKEKSGRTRSVLKLVDSVDEDLKGRSSKLKVSECEQNNGQDHRKSTNQKTPSKKEERKTSHGDVNLREDKTPTKEKKSSDCDGGIPNSGSRRRTRSSGVFSQTEQSPETTTESKVHKKPEKESNLDSKNKSDPISTDVVGTLSSANKESANIGQRSSRLTQIEKTVGTLHTYAKDSSNNSVDNDQTKIQNSTLDEVARIPKRGRPPKHVKQIQQKSMLDVDKIKSEPISPQRTSPRRPKTSTKSANLDQTDNVITSEQSNIDEMETNDVAINNKTDGILTAISTRTSPRKRSTTDTKCNDVELETKVLEPLSKKQCKSNVAKDLNKQFNNTTENELPQNDDNVAHNSKQNIPSSDSSITNKSKEHLFSRRSRRLSGRDPDCEEANQTTQAPENVQSQAVIESDDKELKVFDSEQEINLQADTETCDIKVFEEDEIGYEGLPWYQDEPDENEPFYFESDHTALKGNKDYRMLLRTLATLEAQRQQAIQNLEKLSECQKSALCEPVEFVKNLQNKVDINLPVAQRVVAIPNINWEKYISKLEGTQLIKFSTDVRNTRASKSSSAASVSIDTNNPSTSKDSMLSSTVSIKKEEDLIRGRPIDMSKSETFNQLWTVEEQRRLEECLVNYPQEDVEARRWEKVANALGNRTPQQVASRVQKYFIKLSKAGLPVPGRMPNLNMYMNKKTNRRMHQFTRPLLHQNSTFMQAYKPPVYMPDEEDDFNRLNNSFDNERTLLDDSIPAELQDTEEYQELLRLTRLKSEMQERDQGEHLGFKCDQCGIEPITGTRWHCKDCPQHVSVDLCPICIDSKYSTDVHTVTHRMEPIQPANQNRTFEDKDYTKFTMGLWDYNYLDPNYNPANL